MSLAEYNRDNHSNNTNTPWCDDAVRLLTQLWDDGVIAAKIAIELNEKFGFLLTKSAITCKAGRLMLKPRKGHMSAAARRVHQLMRRREWLASHREEINARRRVSWAQQPRPVRQFNPNGGRNRANTPWVGGIVTRLRELWESGTPSPKIAETLSAEFGVIVTDRACRRKARSMYDARPQILGREGHFKWDQKQDARLTELWAQGKSGSIIAKTMGDEFDRPFTRNSIISRARKLWLHPRKPGGGIAETDPAILAARAERRRLLDRERHARRPRSERKPIATQEKHQRKINLRSVAPQIEDWSIPTPQRKTLFALGAHDCRWPVGEPKSDQFFFCGAAAENEKPYCSSHCRRAYIETRSY